MVPLTKKTCAETKTYMFNNPHSNRRILVNRLGWNENWVHFSCPSSHLLNIPFFNICLTIELSNKINFHMLDIPYVQQPTCTTLYRLSGLPNILACFILL